MPRGPAGLVLIIILLALLVALIVAASVLLVVAAIVFAVGLAVYQGVRGTLFGGRPRRRELPVVEGRFFEPVHGNQPPLEQYLTLVDAFDLLTTEALKIDAAGSLSWRGGRRLARLLSRSERLREHAIQVERRVSADRGADTARPGLWELVVAATELQHYLQGLLEFPSGRGRAAQARELAALQARREDLDRRRAQLIRRLQETDLRAQSRAVGG